MKSKSELSEARKNSLVRGQTDRQRLSHNSVIKGREDDRNLGVKSLVLALFLILRCDLRQVMTQVTLDLSVPTMQGCHGGTWASVEDRRFMDKGFALNTTCLSPFTQVSPV